MPPLDKVLVTLLLTLDKTALLFTIVSEVLALVTALLVKVVLLFTPLSETLALFTLVLAMFVPALAARVSP